MGGAFLIFLVINIGLFCCIFWALTWISEYFYLKKNHRNAKKFIECGFKSTVNKLIQVNSNFLIFVIFLILYDIEFIFLVPAYINFNFISIGDYFVFFLSFFFIIFSLSVDIQLNALKWKI